MEWGCDTDAVIPLVIDDEQVWRCPRRPFKDDPFWFNAIMTSYKYAQQGQLTEEGTWLDQPAMLTSAFEILDVVVEEVREKKKAKEASQARVQQGGGQQAKPPPPERRNATPGMSNLPR